MLGGDGGTYVSSLAPCYMIDVQDLVCYIEERDEDWHDMVQYNLLSRDIQPGPP